MDGHVLLLVLAAALLHATWNSIVKGGSNKLFESSMNALGGGLGALLILPFLPAPAPESWGLLALSCCFHLTYYICISQAYDKVDLSMGYTIMRGCAPMITALALLLLGNHISLTGWGGVLLLCLGILTLTLEHVHKGARAADILICLRTSLVIAGYTLADGYGARASGNGVSYTCWISSSISSPSMPMCSGGTAAPTSAICGSARPRACSAACAVWAPTASPSGP